MTSPNVPSSTLDDRLLNGISVLAAVVEAGSFVRAAKALGVTQPADSRAVSRLEARIGIRLLDRTTRSLTLTADGRRLYEEISPLLSLELLTRTELGDLASEGFDLAIRFVEPPSSSSLVARKLLETRVVTVAAPSYLKKHGRPKKLTDLANHHCLQFRNPVTSQPFEWEFHRGRRVVPIQTAGRLLLTDAQTLIGSCVAGAGIAQLLALAVQ